MSGIQCQPSTTFIERPGKRGKLLIKDDHGFPGLEMLWIHLEMYKTATGAKSSAFFYLKVSRGFQDFVEPSTHSLQYLRFSVL
jgi:hypothetical protein